MGKKSRNKKIIPAAQAVTKREESTGISKWLIAVLALGLLIKVSYLFSSRNSPYFEPVILDPEYYHNWALRILRGDWVGEGVFYGLPLYPFFLAACYALSGGSLIAAKLIQALLGVVTLFFIYKTGEKMASKNVGLLAAFLATVYGPLFFHESILIPEALGMPLYAAGFYLSLSFAESQSIKRALILGVVFGLAALTKTGILIYAVLFLIILFVKALRADKRSLKAIGVCFVALLMTLAPVTAHNFYYGKDFVPLTSHSGFNFYIGNNPESQGVFKAPEGTGTNVTAQIKDSRRIAETALGRSLKSSEVSRYWSDKAWTFIKSQPIDFLKLAGRKLLLFFDAREISDVDDYEFSKQFTPFLKWPWLTFGLLGPLALVGLMAMQKNRRWVYLWIFSYLSGLIFFFINARYRLPILNVFFVLASTALFELVDFFKRKNFMKISAWVILCYMGFSIVNLNFNLFSLGHFTTKLRLVETDWSKNYTNTGDIYMMRQENDKALLFYDKALEVDPSSFKATQGKALALSALGRHDEARTFYERGIKLKPNDSAAYNNLGLWHSNRGELREAEVCFIKAVELDPQSSQSYNNLGMLYGNTGKNEEAKYALEKSLALNPSSAQANTNLAVVLCRMGRAEEAKGFLKKALAIDPNFKMAKIVMQQLEDARFS